MEWQRVFETFLGTLAGGLIAVGSMWIKEIWDRRKEVRSWFEQNYITEGLDPIIAYINLGRTYLHAKKISIQGDIFKPEILDDIPFGPLERVDFLLSLNSGHAAGMTIGAVMEIRYVKNLPLSIEIIEQRIEQLGIIHGHLVFLRRELLAINVKTKGDVYDIGKRESVSSFICHFEAELRAFAQSAKPKVQNADLKTDQGISK